MPALPIYLFCCWFGVHLLLWVGFRVWRAWRRRRDHLWTNATAKAVWIGPVYADKNHEHYADGNHEQCTEENLLYWFNHPEEGASSAKNENLAKPNRVRVWTAADAKQSMRNAQGKSTDADGDPALRSLTNGFAVAVFASQEEAEQCCCDYAKDERMLFDSDTSDTQWPQHARWVADIPDRPRRLKLEPLRQNLAPLMMSKTEARQKGHGMQSEMR